MLYSGNGQFSAFAPQQTAPLPQIPNAPARGLSASVSAGIHGGRDHSVGGGMGTGIKLCLMPALELIDRLIARRLPTNMATPSEALASYLADTMTLPQLKCICDLHGVVWEHMLQLISASRRKPEQIELGVLRNRQYIDDKEYADSLRSLGFTDVDERNNIESLRNEVVGPSDLVRFALRHVFEPDLTAKFGHNDEYRPVLDFYHQTAGLNYSIFTGPLRQTITGTLAEQPQLYTELQEWAKSEGIPAPPAPDSVPEWLAGLYTAQKLPEPSWAKAFWWSHWVWPSPTQAYEMLFRLRPDRIKAGEPDWMKPLSFTIDDVRSLLRGNDYAPYWRDKLAAIAYRLPPLRSMRQLIQGGKWGADRVTDIFLSSGYRPSDAEDMADSLIYQVQEAEREKVWKVVEKELEKAWELGLISDDEVRQEFIAAKIDPQLADAQLKAWTARRNTQVATQLVKDIRQRYLTGVIDATEAYSQLRDVGIVERRRQEYLLVWQSELKTKHRELQAGKLVSLAGENLVGIPELVVRLRNLHYSDRDIEILLAEVRTKRAAAVAKAAKELYKQQQQGVQALKRQRSDIVAALRATQAALAKHGTPVQLRDWYCADEITATDVTNRLLALSWPQEDINRLLGECDGKRIKAGLSTYSQETGTQTFPLS